MHLIFLTQVSTKVKDNKDELLRLSRRIEHIVVKQELRRYPSTTNLVTTTMRSLSMVPDPSKMFIKLCLTIVSSPALRG
jgi:hypothetical protein